ncbi:hypothetical protein HY990_03400 [Candidatus Micrarchaeota archaeon]|nr:hypothetical protein [Candidatus Micrarchaeota archaeon]
MNTTISITSETRELLKQFGTKGSTYEDILKNLMEIARYHGFLEQQKWILQNEKFHSVDTL